MFYKDCVRSYFSILQRVVLLGNFAWELAFLSDRQERLAELHANQRTKEEATRIQTYDQVHLEK